MPRTICILSLFCFLLPLGISYSLHAQTDDRQAIDRVLPEQLAKIREHIAGQGFLVLGREPTDEERLAHRHILTFKGNPGVNAFRTDMDAAIGQKLSAAIEGAFGEPPVKIRTMGGTVPIIEAVNTLNIPAVIVPMVNMDNNQHNPNENIRLGNMRDGIQVCLAMLRMDIP